jgi:MFS family permease
MGAATDAALLQQIIVGAVNLSFTVLAILTVDRFGRRPLMIIGALVMAVSMLSLGTTFYTHSVGVGSLICMLVYTAGFAMSWGPVCWVYWQRYSEFDPFGGDEYCCRCAMDCQFYGIMDLSYVGQESIAYRNV